MAAGRDGRLPERERRLREQVIEELSTPLPKDESMLKFLYGDGNKGSALLDTTSETQSGARPSEAFQFSTPVFLLETFHPSLMPGVRPGVADVELDLAYRPVISLSYVVAVGTPGATYEFSTPLYLRYRASDRAYEMEYWDEGESGHRRTVLDPWEREDTARVELDPALDEIGELDRTDPSSPSRALDLTFRLLHGWFRPAPLTVTALAPWSDAMVVRKLKERGVWVDGPPPWRPSPDD